MAIDYSHIPIWLRCTNRHLINPEEWDIYGAHKHSVGQISERDRQTILRMREEGKTYRVINAETGVSQKAISRIVRENNGSRNI